MTDASLIEVWHMAGTVAENPARSIGFWGVLLGAIGVVLAFLPMIGPMMEPQPSVGTQVGEIAGDIMRSAWQSFRGQEVTGAEPQPQPIWVKLGFGAPVLGVIAIVLSMVSGLKRENWHYAFYGTGLGIAAVVFYFAIWIALVFAGILLLVAIIENLGGIFGGGLFGG